LSAIERVPRDMFVPESMSDRAYENSALPIGFGQNISAPLVIGQMVQLLPRDEKLKILEIGTGSGYQTAILSDLYRRVYTIEIERELLDTAQRRWEKLEITNIVTRHADGQKGWGEQAPFDAMIVSVAFDDAPGQLLAHLRVGGFMIIPIGNDEKNQVITKITKTNDGFNAQPYYPVQYMPWAQTGGTPNRAVI
jgi:protein-L-isoaspartate(D-aspartate) O-methyltransferase